MSVNHYEPPPSPRQAAYTAPVKQRSALRRFFSGAGAAITWTRNTVLNVFFLIFVLIILAAVGSNAPHPLPEKFVLRVAPSGILVDQRSYIDAASLLLSDEDPQESENVVRDMVEAINKAATDPRVNALILEPSMLLGGGTSKLDEIGQALTNFKRSKKKVIAVSDNYSQDQYYLASFADEIYLHEMGLVEISGFSRYMTYYKTALDKLGITVHAFRSGKYKDYLEPYLRDDMSQESEEHNLLWINELWASYTKQVESARELPANSINDYVNNLDSHMALTAGNSAKLALQKGLVDKITSRQQMEQMLFDVAGKNHDNTSYNGVDVKAYLADSRKKPQLDNNKIGLLVASGSILDGHQPDGTIGGDTMVELLRQVRDDQAVKALVIRVDSGGGSAFASEIIRSEIVALKQKGIPVFISMGTVAASGGYWIATAGDQIWALPTTITGSIGVFGAFPTLDKSLEKIGVNTDGVGSTELAGAMRLDRPLSEKAGKVVQYGVDNIYQRFITLVAAARKKELGDIDAIAQGHVWTGTKAQELGLVDHLGTLEDVIAAIAIQAKLDSYKVELIEQKRTPQEEFLHQLTASNASALAPKAFTEKFASLGVLNNLAPLLQPLNNLQKMNDPQGIYVQCLECVAP